MSQHWNGWARIRWTIKVFSRIYYSVARVFVSLRGCKTSELRHSNDNGAIIVGCREEITGWIDWLCVIESFTVSGEVVCAPVIVIASLWVILVCPSFFSTSRLTLLVYAHLHRAYFIYSQSTLFKNGEDWQQWSLHIAALRASPPIDRVSLHGMLVCVIVLAFCMFLFANFAWLCW
jgi:hypothetical protein